MMTGTWINIATVLIGSTAGLLFGARFPDRIRESVINVLGVFTLAIGAELFIRGTSVEGENILLPLVGLLIGVILGEWWRLEARLKSLGAFLEKRFVKGSGEVTQGNRFIRGFVSASLLFCVGPMTILGSIQDGLTGNYELLAVKSVMDGFASLALASSFGVGVLFSTLIVLFYQGGLTLAAASVEGFFDQLMLAEISVVGGVLLIGLAIGTLLELRPIRTANMLPALVITPLAIVVLRFFGLM
ncbi:MAG: DUF554 domain-containing protein [Anaerolineales bacterium]|nr:DUF554 domain-containing protein [Anaerolineales bacterium]